MKIKIGNENQLDNVKIETNSENSNSIEVGDKNTIKKSNFDLQSERKKKKNSLLMAIIIPLVVTIVGGIIVGLILRYI